MSAQAAARAVDALRRGWPIAIGDLALLAVGTADAPRLAAFAKANRPRGISVELRAPPTGNNAANRLAVSLTNAAAAQGGGAADGTAGAAAFRGRGGRTGLCGGASSAAVAFPAPAVGLSVNSTGVPSAAPSRAFRIPFRSATAVPLTAVILHSTRAPLVCEAGAASGSVRGRRVDRQAGGEEGIACKAIN